MLGFDFGAARSVGLAALLSGMIALAPSAQAGPVLERVRAAGLLHCGVSEGIDGFSQRDPSGRWQGLDADFCRAVAAAVLGDAESVSFVPLSAAGRFPALQSGRVDLLARNTTWTLTREAALKVQFPAVIFYDGQGFMVRADAGIERPEQLAGSTICVEKGTNHQRNLKRYADASAIELKPLVLDSPSAVAEAFFSGECRAYTSDASQLAATLHLAPQPVDYLILPQRISREPLAPVVWEGDAEWTTVVRWVLFALVLAEDDGITRANAAERVARGTAVLAQLSADDKKLLGQALGIPMGWAVRAVQAVGNYGELYERTVGQGSPLRIERGLNRLWSQGGLMYAPPID
jgi:general L-amino acid transport system substrate-binding protein